MDSQAGATPPEVLVAVDPRGLPLGTHRGMITISADGAANSPLSMPVDLHIVDHLHTTYLPQIAR